MPYPNYLAGQRLRALDLTRAQPVYVRKGADEPRASNTALTNDSALALPVEAGVVYTLHSNIYYSTRSDTDFKCRWSLPSGFMEWTGQALAVGGTGSSGDVYFERLVLGSIAQWGGADATNAPIMSITIQGTVTIGATGGNMRLQWGQITTNATATIVRGDSYIELRPVA